MWASWKSTEYIIKGKWWLPQVWAVMSLVSPSCLWFVLTPKVFQLYTNHWMFGFVQVRVSSWCLSFFLVPSQSSSTPLYPQSAANQGVCPTPYFFVVFSLNSRLSPLRSLGVRHILWLNSWILLTHVQGEMHFTIPSFNFKLMW